MGAVADLVSPQAATFVSAAVVIGCAVVVRQRVPVTPTPSPAASPV